MAKADLATLVQQAAEVAETIVRPEAARVDRDGQWPEQAIRALQSKGLAGLAVPTEHGGLGQGLSALARVCDVLGQACASTAMCYGMHVVGSAVLAAKATPDHDERFLRAIARGEHLTTLALSEPGTGSHFYIPETTLTANGDAFVLRGHKSFVTNGGHADSYVMSAAAGEASAPGQFSCIVVPEGAPGLSWGPVWNGIGMRGNSSRHATLLDTRVRRENLLGREGDQVWYVFSVVAPYFLTAMSGTYVGVAAASLDAAQTHLAKRSHSHTGEPLGRQSVLQHRLGTLWADVARARALLHHAASEGDAGSAHSTPLLLSAKAEAAECATRVANEALTLMGGVAYAEGSEADRHLRDARAAHVMAPTTDLLRTWTGRWLLGEPLLAE